MSRIEANIDYVNPNAPTLVDPTGIDQAIQTVQVQLASQLSWLTKSYGRARTHSTPDPAAFQGVKKSPWVYDPESSAAGDGDYIPVLHNDNIAASCFWQKMDPDTALNYTPAKKPMMFTSNVAVIFTIDLLQVDQSKNYHHNSELLEQILAVLAGIQSVRNFVIYDEDPRQIFKGYTIDESYRQLLMYPQAAIRIEMQMSWNHDFCGLTFQSPASSVIDFAMPAGGYAGSGQDLQTQIAALQAFQATAAQVGYGVFQDSQYTAGSPLQLAADTPTQLTVDKLGSLTDESNLPPGFEPFWDNNKVDPQIPDSLFLIRFNMRVVPLFNNAIMKLTLDVGGVFDIDVVDYVMSRGAGVEHEVNFIMGPSFVSQGFINLGGGTVLIECNSACDVYSIDLIAEVKK